MRREEELECDVLVLGGGLAGICAAVQAARLGCEVILLERDPVLGGNSGPMVGIQPSGAHAFHPYAAETGIIGEIEEEAAWRHAKTLSYKQRHNVSQQWDSLLQELLGRAGARVFRRTYAREPEMDGRRIAGVLAEDTARYRSLRIRVRGQVVEASGDGHIAALAGASYRQGREGRAEFGERGAPEEADGITLGSSLTATVRKTGEPVRFVPPADTPPFQLGYGFTASALGTERCLLAHGEWHPDAELCFLVHTETGGQGDTVEDEHAIHEELLRQLYSVWNHIKNEAHAEAAANWDLVWVSPRPGKRESRRFAAGAWVTQNDVESGAAVEDEVAFGGYAVDVHEPIGERNAHVEVVYHSVPPLWSVPYRALYSRDVENLFLAGRLAGVTHLALGSYRMQKTLAAAGQAIGAAAALCREHGCGPAEISGRIGELQQLLLREDATLLHVRGGDPADLARTARITAGSEQRHGVTQAFDWLLLDRARGVQLWDWHPELRSARVLVMNPGDAVASAAQLLHIRSQRPYRESHERIGFPYERVANRMEWGDDNLLEHFETVAEVPIEVPARFAGWLEIPFGQTLGEKDPASDDERWMLLLGEAPGVCWARDMHRYDFARRVWQDPGRGDYSTDGDSHCFLLDPAPAYGEAANVANGWNRRFATNPVNMWMSARAEPMPQWLLLEWDEPQAFDTVHLVFDTLMRTEWEMPFNRDEEVAPLTVADYLLEAWDGAEWRELARVRQNYHRRRVHRFPELRASRLRLTVEHVWGEGTPARVYEVRVYRAAA